MEGNKLNAVIYGATGAIGSELVTLLTQSPKWNKIYCVVRNELEQWRSLPNYSKLAIQQYNNLDDYFNAPPPYANVNASFCCFGSQVKHGEDTFRKIDKTYPLLAADIALANKIPHYLLLSSMGGNADSWFLYFRVKGEVEQEMARKNLPYLSILKPGLLVHRRNARFGEKCVGWIPFISKIQARHCAEVMIELAERQMSETKVNVYDNGQMLELHEQIKR